MKLIAIFAGLGALLGLYLIDESRFAGAALGAVGGGIIGVAVRSFPRDEPKDGRSVFDDEDH